MAATRLSDSQKQELVARFRQGETSQVLAEAFGCSTNTVSRVVRTALDPEDYGALKQQHRGRSAAPGAGPAGGANLPLPLADGGGDRQDGPPRGPAGADAGGDQAPSLAEHAAPSSTGIGDGQAAHAHPSPTTRAGSAEDREPGLPAVEPPFDAWVQQQIHGTAIADVVELGAADGDADSQDSPADGQGHAALAIDDADDFADEAGEDDDEGDSSEEGEDGDDRFQADDGADRDSQTFVVLPLGQTIEDRPSPSVQPLVPADLPASVYMLVDKTVELDIKPLKDLPELGTLPEDEAERQALVLYANPRQAKRYCGRNQRVIKVPDSGVLARTAPYLLSQGVTRLVVEGALYSLPGS